jgi:apolipoprotein N-acyltransferase
MEGRDRLSYLWLAIAVALMPFAAGKWTLAIAAWGAPVFWLRFVRTQPLFLMSLASGLLTAVDWPGNSDALGPVYYVLAFVTGLVYAVPYLIDRVVSPRLTGVASTLVFPCALTAISYLNSLLSPFGTWGNTAYTQYGDLPLLQLLSVTGVWGIDFLMGWGAATINWAGNVDSCGAGSDSRWRLT